MALGNGAEWKNFRSFFDCVENVFMGQCLLSFQLPRGFILSWERRIFNAGGGNEKNFIF